MSSSWSKTRAEDVVRHPAENRGEHEKDGDAAIDAGKIRNVLSRIGRFRHAHQGTRRQAARQRAGGALLARLSVRRLHVFKLSQPRGENVIRHPTQDRSKHSQEDERASIERGLHQLLRRVGAIREKHGSRRRHSRRLRSRKHRIARHFVSHSFTHFPFRPFSALARRIAVGVRPNASFSSARHLSRYRSHPRPIDRFVALARPSTSARARASPRATRIILAHRARGRSLAPVLV